MFYKRTGAVGVRAKGGKQAFQALVKGQPGAAQLIADKAAEELEAGVSLDQVKAWVNEEKLKAAA